MDPDTIPNLLAELRDGTSEGLEHYYITFEDYWERKLWHELTESLLEFFANPESRNQRIPLFITFVSSFADKINQLQLVTIALNTASQFPDDASQLTFLTKLADRVSKPASQDAFVYAKVAVASIKLRQADEIGARADLDASSSILDTFDSVETVVHASFYRVSADYYQSKQEFASYYKSALLYLACVNVADLTTEDRRARAHDLCVAALVSDSIYNFGELLLHPILDSLRDTPQAWLRDLLFAFNRGNLRAYDVLSGHVSQDPLLRDREVFLHQKISLAALTESVFRRPPHDRAMTFTTIRNETNVPSNEIEHLVMKALSLGLVRGTIDQVAQVADINWVQPKVLDMAQIEGMRQRLHEWDASVNKLGTWMEGVGKDVWAA